MLKTDAFSVTLHKNNKILKYCHILKNFCQTNERNIIIRLRNSLLKYLSFLLYEGGGAPASLK
jgi:hypothetical protein